LARILVLGWVIAVAAPGRPLCRATLTVLVYTDVITYGDSSYEGDQKKAGRRSAAEVPSHNRCAGAFKPQMAQL
jgi:hypothetical protein